jgi:hypothetical protein
LDFGSKLVEQKQQEVEQANTFGIQKQKRMREMERFFENTEREKQISVEDCITV